MIREKIRDGVRRGLYTSRLEGGGKRSILLTFDDGPHPTITAEVLERLARYGARAIFFVVGCRIAAAPHLLKRILEEGHLIGNHTYLHSNGSQPGFLEYRRDLARCQSLVEYHTGQRPRLFRPPGGRTTLAGLLAPRLLGLDTVMWSLEGRDWAFYHEIRACEISEYLLRRLVPRDIILLHDDNPNTPLVLDTILPAMTGRGLDLNRGIEFLY